MIYVIAWLVIGFTCSMLVQSYMTDEYLQFTLDELLEEERITKQTYDAVQLDKLKIAFSIVVVLYGVFGILEYYNTKRRFNKMLDSKQKKV